MQFVERAGTRGSYGSLQPLWVCRCGIELTVRAAAGNGGASHAVRRGGVVKATSLRDLRQMLVDVRERAKIHRERAVSARERTRMLAESLRAQKVGAIAINGQAKHLAANQTVCAITGYSEAELQQMTIWSLVADRTIRKSKSRWREFLRDGQWEGSCRLRRKAGDIVLIRYVAAANVLKGVHVSAMTLRKPPARPPEQRSRS